MYPIINNLSIDFQFSTKTKEELKFYSVWFKENKDNRINQLIEIVKATKGFENWNSNFTSNSLKELGKWLYENVETKKISQEEYNKKRAEIPNHIDISDWDLTIKTRSLLIDSGIYFGEVFIKEYPNLKWEQYFSRIKRDIDNGHMIVKLKKNDLNPIWVLYIVGLGLADKTKDENCLYNLFKVWEKYL